jgi:hypothetical protein
MKYEILRNGHVLCHLVYGKLTNMNFNILCKTASCFGKLAFLVTYDFRLKSSLYENVCTGIFTSDFNILWLFTEFLHSDKSKRKTDFLEVLDFDAKKFKIEFFFHFSTLFPSSSSME